MSWRQAKKKRTARKSESAGKTGKVKQSSNQRKLLFQELEPRVLYSADGIGGADALLDEANAVEVVIEEVASAKTESEAVDYQYEAPPPIDLSAFGAEVETEPAREIVFVDSDTEAYQQLVEDLLNNGDESRGFDVFVLDNTRDGIEQIGDVLAAYDSLDAVHVISHGSDGTIDLGQTRFDIDTLNANAVEIAAWGYAFDNNADFLIYGCNLAASAQGQSFVDTLAALADVDVAASDDLTGNLLLGGDWQLEYQTGSIDTAIAVGAGTQRSYAGILAGSAPTATSDPGDYSVRLLSENPISYWRLSEAAGGTAADQGSGANTGTYHGVALGQAGALNGDSDNAAYFDGSAYVEIPHANDHLLDNGTIQLWFNADATANGVVQNLFSKDSNGLDTGGHVSIYLTASGQVEARLQSTSGGNLVTSPAPVSTGQWHHVALSFGSNGMVLYVDGKLVDSNAYTGGLSTTSGGAGNFEPIAIGAGTRHSGDLTVTPVTELFTGFIDEVAILGGELDAPAINELYAAGLQEYRTQEDVSLVVTAAEGVLINDWDDEGDPITAILVSGPTNAQSFTLNPDGSFSYTPIADFNGVDTFTYKANDGNSDSNIAAVVITVTPVADPPAITSDGSGQSAAVSVAENTAAVTTVTAADPDFDTVTFAISGGSDSGLFEIDANTGALRFKTAPDFENPADTDSDNVYLVEVRADDNNGAADVQAITVSVTDVITDAVDDTYSTNEATVLSSDDTWADPAWQFRRLVTFDNSTRAENLTEFPILIVLGPTTIDYAQTQNQGQDLRFYDDDGNLLAHEIETWNESGASHVWVKVPQIDGNSTNDYVHMYYGNAAAADAQNAAGVWSDYRGVYHFGGDPGAGGVVDDAAGNHDGTNVGTADSAGYVGNARGFDGASQYVDLGDERDWINGASAATLSIWMNADTIGGSGDMLGVTRNMAGSGASRIALIRSGDDVTLIARTMDDSSDAITVTTNTNLLAAGSWHHVTGTVDYASDADNIKIYIDGKLQGTFSHDFTLDAIPNTNSSHAAIGTDEDGGAPYFDGRLDEARIASELRSEDWVSAQYAAMTGKLATIGIEQTRAGLLGNDIDVLALMEINGNPADVGTPIVIASGALLTVHNDGTFSYDPNGQFDSLGVGQSAIDTFTYTVTDGDGTTDTATVTITVNGVNDSPVMTEWFDSAWTARKALTIDAAQVAGDVSDFPVLISLTVDQELAAQALANGDDIIFTAADGSTQLAHEIEYFNEATGELRAWVKTDLSANVDTDVFMYYGNAAATNQENAAGVWSSNYVGVYHLGESPTGVAGELVDSSGSGNHATTEGSMDAADSVATAIGQGLVFDGVNDKVRIPDSASLDGLNDAATFSLWINWVDSADGDHQIIMTSENRFSGGDGYEWASQGDGDHFFYPDATSPDGNYNLGPDPFTNGQWHHLAVTMDYAAKDVNIYVDGSAMTFNYEGVPTKWTDLSDSGDLLWGGNPDRASRFFLGMMDEIRLSDTVRSQAWIQTEANNQTNPGVFISAGTAQTQATQHSLTDIDEDDVTSPGDSVLTVIDSIAGDRITDVDDGAVEGIAVTGVDDTNGVWQYDANADGTWVAFGAVSDSAAVLLDTGALVRFVPDPDYNGTAGELTFRAWDQTSGSNGDTAVNVTDNGDDAAFGSATATATLNVNPIEDPAVISGIFAGAVAEGNIGDTATAAGTISIFDVDDDDNPAFNDVGSTVGTKGYGSFVLSSGTWAYTLDQTAVQNLDAGDVVNDTITYTATDGSTQTITVTITGTDDASVITGTVLGAVNEGDIGDTVTATGSIGISDVDDDHSPVFNDVGSTPGTNSHGSFVLTSGTWTYTLDQTAVQNLDAGDIVNDSITVTATDGSMQTITVTITGTDDVSIITGTSTGAVAEGNIGDTPVVATGSITISDVDDDDSPVFSDVGSTPGANGYGSFTLTSGTWTYTLNQAAVQDLDAGDVVSDTITYVATDGSTQSVTVAITGTDDASVITGTFTGTVIEGNIGNVTTAGGTIGIVDADADDTPIFADTAIATAYGNLTLSSGSWTYTLNESTVQDLDAGDVVGDFVLLTATDGSTQGIAITITGTDDASVVSGTFTGSIAEGNIGDAAATTSGTLAVSDADQDDVPVFTDVAATVGDNAYGSFTLSAGTWTYMLDQSATQHLDVGDSVWDTVTFVASDGQSRQVAVTIVGTADAPRTLGVGAVSVNEDGPASSIDLYAAFDDLEDADAALTYTVTSNTNAGLFAGVDSTGSTLNLAYTPDAFGNAAITLRATDSQGGFVETTFNVTVAPVNDAPTLLANSGVETEDAELLILTVGELRAADIDNASNEIIYTLTSDPAGGTLQRGATILGAGASFTQADIDSHLVTYIVNEDSSPTVAFTFTLSDAAGANMGTHDFAVTVFGGDDSEDIAEEFIQHELRQGDSDPAPAPAEAPATGDAAPAADPVAQTSPQIGESLPGGRVATPEIYAADADTAALHWEMVEGREPRQADSGLGRADRFEVESVAAVPLAVPVEQAADEVEAEQADARLTEEERADRITHVLQQALDGLASDLDEAASTQFARDEFVMAVGHIGGAGLSAGVLAWLFRAGSLLASVLSVMPLWTRMDPLPVLLAKKRREDEAVDMDDDEKEAARILEGDTGDNE